MGWAFNISVRFYFIILLSLPFTLHSQKEIIYPNEFPKNLIGKKLCGQISTTGKMFGGSTAFLDLPVEIYISKDIGIYARYNPREQFHENKWGETQKIDIFNLWKTIPRTDQYGDLIGIEYHYKVPQCDWINNSNHCISALSVYDFYGSQDVAAGKFLSISVSVPSYEAAHIYTGYKNISICGQLKTQLELQKEKEELLKIENQKKEQDKFTALKIDSLLSLNLPEDAAMCYEKLNFPSFESKNKIQSLLEIKHKNDTASLDKETVLNYINYQIKTKNTQLLKLGEGEHEIIFNTMGKATNVDLPNIGIFESNANIPSIKVGSFEIKQHSRMALKITVRDSILILNNFSSGCTKTIYVDKNENFYLKTKTGLPTAYVSYNYKLDKRLVRIFKAFKQEKYINGVVAESINYTSEKFKKILKKEK
jgi:hypothetical protein